MQTLAVHEQLTRIFNLLRTETRRVGNCHALLPVQVEILHYLCVCNQYSNTPLAVAEYIGTTKGTVSQTLKALERKGLVEKTADARDKRVVRLEVTRKGRQIVDRIVPGPILQGVIADLPEDAVQRVGDTLQILLGAMEKATSRGGFGPCRTCKHLEPVGRTAPRCARRNGPVFRKDLGLLCRDHAPAPSPLVPT